MESLLVACKINLNDFEVSNMVGTTRAACSIMKHVDMKLYNCSTGKNRDEELCCILI